MAIGPCGRPDSIAARAAIKPLDVRTVEMNEDQDYLSQVEGIGLPPQHLELVRRVRQVGREIIGPAAPAVDSDRRYPHEAMAALHAAGLTTLYVPERAGGLGLSAASSILPQALITMELSAWCSSTAQIYGAHCNVLRYVSILGGDELQSIFHKQAVDGLFFGAFGSENNADRFALGSRMQPDGADYRLTGKKHFATSSTGSSWAYWLSLTHDGRLLMPMVDLRAPGITIIDNWMGVGQRGTGSGVVVADNVHIPAGHVMWGESPENRPSLFENAMNLIFAAQFAGLAIGAYRTAIAYVREKARPWRGLTSATQDPFLRLRVADMAVKINAARQMVIHAGRAFEQFAADASFDPLTAIAVSQAKVITTETALDVTSGIFQVMGASSATTTYGFDRYFRDARTLTLHDPVDRRRELIGSIELGSAEDHALTFFSKPGADAAAPAPASSVRKVDNEGILHFPNGDLLPYSDLASVEAKRNFVEATLGAEAIAQASAEGRVPSGETAIGHKRRMLDETLMIPSLEKLKQYFQVEIAPASMGGVTVDIVTPTTPIAPENRHRVLINLHGGGMQFGARYGGQLEAVPVAGIGGVKVVAVDYRMAPESRYPAAEEDVEAVYRELLKDYQPENIGIYGSSAGGYLTGAAVAWFRERGLPRPGAIGMFHGNPIGGSHIGDSQYFFVERKPRDSRAFFTGEDSYFAHVDVDDPTSFPAFGPDILAMFPPALLLSGTRDPQLSRTVYAHSRLVDLGVEADLHVWEGVHHCSFTQPVVDPFVPESQQAWSVIARFFDKHLGSGDLKK
jgi:alkylation response protein AidB-like acyl-CoA dehydrogenase/acetyl esterase/lipase